MQIGIFLFADRSKKVGHVTGLCQFFVCQQRFYVCYFNGSQFFLNILAGKTGDVAHIASLKLPF